MGHRTRGEELLMTETVEVPWVKLTAVVGGVLALAVVVRGVIGVVRIAIGEARYKAGDPDTWTRWLK
jgi:hypothetical protein